MGANLKPSRPAPRYRNDRGHVGRAARQIARRSALQRLPAVEDVGHAVESLLGDDARSMTGTVLTVDAGSTDAAASTELKQEAGI
jgi:enoyl-[acyl-carrier-protein] reductase (NADH)